MENDYSDGDLSEGYEEWPRYCGDCRVLTEALRDMEQQCREAEDDHYRDFPISRCDIDALDRVENAYLAKLSKLQRRRDCALEVLLKHQGLEHSGR
jgi:hypothetical protein